MLHMTLLTVFRTVPYYVRNTLKYLAQVRRAHESSYRFACRRIACLW